VTTSATIAETKPRNRRRFIITPPPETVGLFDQVRLFTVPRSVPSTYASTSKMSIVSEFAIAEGMTCSCRLNDAKRQALGTSIEQAVCELGYTVWACAIMRNHVHLCVRRHRNDAHVMWNKFAEATRSGLRLFENVPDGHPIWSLRPYKVFLYTPDDVRRVIAYIENNPLKDKLPPQMYAFVTPYDGWPHSRPPQKRRR
jgi:REP element-mobilizing transposase RayT